MSMTKLLNKYCPFNGNNCVRECQLYQDGGCAIAKSTSHMSALKKSVADIKNEIDDIKSKMK